MGDIYLGELNSPSSPFVSADLDGSLGVASYHRPAQIVFEGNDAYGNQIYRNVANGLRFAVPPPTVDEAMRQYMEEMVKPIRPAEPKSKKGKEMNYTHAVFLMNTAARAIVGTYEADEDYVGTTKKPPRTTFKTFDKSIKVGDLVIVPTNTRHKFTVVKVVEVDAEVDYDSHTAIDWIVGTVDTNAHADILSKEKAAIDAIKAGEKRKKMEKMRESFAIGCDEIKALAITAIGAPVEPAGE